MRVLVLGGTAEARALAAALHAQGVDVVSSLAGRVSRPRLPVGEVRIGGFGGPAGLAAYLVEQRVDRLVDATHPFAATMTGHACVAAEATAVPLLRLARPGWREHPDAAEWTWVADYDVARDVAHALGGRPFLTTGRQTLHRFDSWRTVPVLVRLVEPPADPLPATWTVVHDRGPFDVVGEVTLMRDHGTDVLVTKDSGGDYTRAKLDAARSLGVPVVVVSRPAAPGGLHEVSTVDDVLGRLGAAPADQPPRDPAPAR